MIRYRNIKLILLIMFVGFLIFFLISSSRTTPKIHANTVLAESHTGSPGEPDTCATSGCHSATLNNGAGILKLQICPSGPYEPGKTYKLTVSQTNPDSSRKRWGFQLTALNNNKGVGTLTPIDTLTKRADSSSSLIQGRQYIEHNDSDAGTFRLQPSAQWTFNWTAPSSEVGPVTFYIAGAQCNNDGTALGDEIYTTTVTLNPKSLGNPVITDVPAPSGAKLNVFGSGFVPGAQIYLDDKRQKTNFSSDTKLVGKKAGKKVTASSVIRVVNPDDIQSNEFRFGSQGFKCPDDQTISVAAGQTTVTLNYNVPVASDDGCSSGGTVTCTPPQGMQIGLGTTTVTCQVSGGGPSCSFTVRVGNCQIDCPASITDTVAAGQNSKVITYPTPTTSGPCGGNVTCSPASGSVFNVGTTTVTCRDSGGASCSFTVTLNPPGTCQLRCPVDITRNGGAQVINYADPDKTPACGAVTCAPPSGSTFNVGTTTVTCMEPGGVKCSFSIIVNAPTPCTLTCPGNITQTAPAGQTSTIVSYTQPTTSGQCGTVSCSPASRSAFPVGTTTVTCTASSGSGSCGFTVTVLSLSGEQSCQLSCPGNITVPPIPFGQTSTPVTYSTTATADCGSVSCGDHPSGSLFPVGITTVTCTTQSGSMCVFTVTVTNLPQPCTVSCPSNITVTIPNGQTSTTVLYATPTGTGDCGAVTCNPPPGTFQLGTTTVTCSSARGSQSCPFTVTVNNPCQLTCPNDIRMSIPGGTGINVTYPLPTKNPNSTCGTEDPICDPPSGSFFPVGIRQVMCSDRSSGATCGFTVTITTPSSPSIGKAVTEKDPSQGDSIVRQQGCLILAQAASLTPGMMRYRNPATPPMQGTGSPSSMLDQVLWSASPLLRSIAFVGNRWEDGG